MLASGETYHIYNRGAHKAEIFRTTLDYERFLLLLYIANASAVLNMRDFSGRYKGRSFAEAFREEQVEKSLVDILAYTLLPNHYHLVLRQKQEDGITRFLKKVGTAYSMYFNGVYGHSGTVFQGRFKSRHVGSEAYFRWVISYVHLNCLDICSPGWKEVGLEDSASAREFMMKYRYSSYGDYAKDRRPERVILADDTPVFLTEQNDLDDLLDTYTKDGPLQDLGIMGDEVTARVA